MTGEIEEDNKGMWTEGAKPRGVDEFSTRDKDTDRATDNYNTGKQHLVVCLL